MWKINLLILSRRSLRCFTPGWRVGIYRKQMDGWKCSGNDQGMFSTIPPTREKRKWKNHLRKAAFVRTHSTLDVKSPSPRWPCVELRRHPKGWEGCFPYKCGISSINFLAREYSLRDGRGLSCFHEASHQHPLQTVPLVALPQRLWVCE